jgi:tRNA(Ile)-lysidine synthase TilS/MesJ
MRKERQAAIKANSTSDKGKKKVQFNNADNDTNKEERCRDLRRQLFAKITKPLETL